MNAPTRRGRFDRRRFLGHSATLGIASLLGVHRPASAEPPPETKRIRLLRMPAEWNVACLAPALIAEELLRAEGFDEVIYVPMLTPPDTDMVAAGKADMTQTDIFAILPALHSGKPLVALGGIHAGCYELYGKSALHSMRDLKGKTIAVANFGRRAFVSAMAAYAGLDPRKDLTFVESWEGVRLLAEGKVDATLGFAPEPQLLREKKIGVSIVNTAVDRPWSQYFCCMMLGNRDFVAKHPVAAKRALRAVLKAADLCAAEPDRVARTLVDRGFNTDYGSTAQALREIPYKRWREYDSADSLRFYALRLHEGGLIKSNPQKLLAQGTDWRFIEQLKKELKA